MGYAKDQDENDSEDMSNSDEEMEKEEEKGTKEEVSELFEKDEFTMLVLDQGVTTLITTLNRINHFRALVYMGNGQGVIGYGYGKGNDMQIAMDNAIRDCKKNLIVIPLDYQMTWVYFIHLYLSIYLFSCKESMSNIMDSK
jgi:small subunit ribosomal protein S5